MSTLTPAGQTTKRLESKTEKKNLKTAERENETNANATEVQLWDIDDRSDHQRPFWLWNVDRDGQLWQLWQLSPATRGHGFWPLLECVWRGRRFGSNQRPKKKHSPAGNIRSAFHPKRLAETTSDCDWLTLQPIRDVMEKWRLNGMSRDDSVESDQGLSVRWSDFKKNKAVVVSLARRRSAVQSPAVTSSHSLKNTQIVG